MIACSGIAGAYLLNSSAKRALTQAEALISWARYLRSEIECFSMPLPLALSRCPTEIYEKCGYVSDGIPADIGEFIKKCRISDGETFRQLSRFGDDIGKGYRDEQLALCDYFIEAMELRRRQLSEQLPARKKLNSALWLSGALALVILLI